MSRKDARKQEREQKKKRKIQNTTSKPKKVENKPKNKKSKATAPATKQKKESVDEEDFGDEFQGFDDDVIEGIPEDDSIDEDDFNSDLGSDDEIDEDDFDDDDEEEPMTAEDTMAALMALKAKKNGKAAPPSTKPKKKSAEPETVEDTMALLKAAKEKKNKEKTEKSKPEKKVKEKKKKEKYVLPEDDAMRRDEEDMKYYAKKLGLKGNKLTVEKDDDGLGGLLDGLDFMDNYDQPSEEYESEEEEKDDEEEELLDDIAEEDEGEEEVDDAGEGDENEQIENPFSSDDEINSSDFDSDVDITDEENEESGDILRPAPKENPYVAPVQSTSKYVPPALRQRLQSGDSEQVSRIKKSIKGPLNKLSEANAMTIINQINGVYSENARQLVTECLTSVVLESIVQQATLLDSFVILHAALAAAVYRLQGVEFGAYFIQTLVEKYESYYAEGRSKEAGNLVSLLTACYSFQVVSCKLLYNLIEGLINETSEMNSELLLRLIKNAGQQMRNDDPNALKEIIVTLQKSVANAKDTNARTRFLVETITNLKNNKSKFNNEIAMQLVTRMKKVLATINNNKFHDPLHVSLDDIHNVKTKGKWWLVGSAWKGNSGDNKPDEEVLVNEEEMNDILDSAEPNWMELARSQRMNTDIRRAIFISIMSSNDFLEAFTKLDKLRLKKSQERETPKILLHCVSIEKVSNPYYSLLANKLCSSHSLRKTFQFCFWDFMKELEGDEDDEDDEDYFKNLNNDLVGESEEFQLQRIVNVGKFFGYLIAEGSLPLHSLKNVNFVALNSDMSLFIEVLMISFFDNIGKKSEVSVFGQGSKKSKASDLKFQDTLLVGILAKCETQKAMLRGLQYFLQEKVKSSDIISGRKQRKRVDWGVDSFCDVADEYLK